MKKNFTLLCLFLAISSVSAQFVPDPNKIYNIAESVSNNVFGGGTQPALTTKLDLRSQAFHFVAVGPANTYYIINGDGKYLNKKGTSDWESIYEVAINGTNSEWVIEGTGATDIRLKNNNNSKYLASDNTGPGSALYTDKAVDNANGLFKVQEAIISALYFENFSADIASWTGWSGAPSTKAGKWIGGIDLATTADATMAIYRNWNSPATNEHELDMTAAAATVTISNINITGYDNLNLNFDNVAYSGDFAPVVEYKSGSGSWTPITVAVATSTWAAQTITLPGLVNTDPLSLRFSSDATLGYRIDNLKLTGTAVVLGTNSNQLSDNSIKVFPNPFVNEFKVDATNSEGPLQVSVFDVLGRKVETAKSSSSQLSIGSSLNSGVYIVKVEGANAKGSKSFKVIKK